jgi:hypothetical protein
LEERPGKKLEYYNSEVYTAVSRTTASIGGVACEGVAATHVQDHTLATTAAAAVPLLVAQYIISGAIAEQQQQHLRRFLSLCMHCSVHPHRANLFYRANLEPRR